MIEEEEEDKIKMSSKLLNC